MEPETQILLATYNGERFLEEQLDSFLDQTYENWEILARDDGSTDSTNDILKEFQKEYPDKITIIEDDDSNLGHCQNFGRLMMHANADIVSFADQDDIWHPDKIKQSIKLLKEMEIKHGTDTPLLVHHDFSTIGAEGSEILSSFNKSNKVGKENSRLNHLLLQNTVTGFASTTNKALIEKVSPLPQSASFHDLYLGIVASSLGHIGYIPKQLANYRVHDRNVFGGKNPFYNLGIKDFSISNLFNGHSKECIKRLLNSANQRLGDKCEQAEFIIDRYGDEIPPEKRKILEDFSKLSEAGTLERKSIIIENGFFPKSLRQSAAFLALG